MTDMCPTCWQQWLAWSSYRAYVPIRLCTPSTSVRNILAANKAREQDRRDLIKRSQRHIMELCAANHHRDDAAVGEVPAHTAP